MDERKLAVKRTAEEACSEILENAFLTRGPVIAGAMLAMFNVMQLYAALERVCSALLASAYAVRGRALDGIARMMDDSDAEAALRLALVMLRVYNDAQASIDKMPDGGL